MKVLVTGGLGFIGSELVRQLLTQGHTVHNIDDMTYAANLSNLDGFADNPLYTLHSFNLTNNEEVKDIFKRLAPFDVVFHLAAHSHVDNSIDGPRLFMENVNGTFNWLDEWRLSLQYLDEQYGKENRSRFIYMSTDEVMGDLPLGGHEKFSIRSPINPSSPYSASKASGELICRSYARTYDLPITCLRSSNAYGPFQHLEKLIPKTIFNCFNGKKIPVYGECENVRDWIFVEDLVDAIIQVGHGSLDTPKVFEIVPTIPVVPLLINIGSNNETTNIDLVNDIIHLTEADEDSVEFVTDRLGHDLKYAIDTREAERLGWKATTSLHDGLMKTIAWYRANEEWCNGSR